MPIVEDTEKNETPLVPIGWQGVRDKVEKRRGLTRANEKGSSCRSRGKALGTGFG